MNIKELDWEDAWQAFLYVTAMCAIALLLMLCIHKKYTKQYSLGTNDNHQLTITKEVDWCIDDEIILDRSITYSEAVRLVDSLNKTIKH